MFERIQTPIAEAIRAATINSLQNARCQVKLHYKDA